MTDILKRFGENPIRNAIVAAVDEMLDAQRRAPMQYVAEREGWLVPVSEDSFSAPVPLQRGALAADVTEHGVLLLPIGRTGRWAIDVRFETEFGPLLPTVFAVRPQAVEVDVAGGGVAGSIRVEILDEGIVWQPRIEGPARELRAALVWTPASEQYRSMDLAGGLLPARQLEQVAPAATRSNSRLPDPGSVPGQLQGIPAVRIEAATYEPGVTSVSPGALLAERATPPGTVVTSLGGWDARHPGRVIATCLDDPSAGPIDVAEPPDFALPDSVELNRQLTFSSRTSLQSAVRRPDGAIISLHGRRDRGMGDVAHLHQSHQMNFVALASGATERVRSELVLAASQQDHDGALRRSPGVAAESYPYTPGFSEVHLLEGVHRYVCWTGDDAILDELVRSDEGASTMRDRLERVANSMIERGRDGLLAPCGWLDAWPPSVRAQAQVSIEGAKALESLAELLRAGGHDHSWVGDAAIALRKSIEEVFYRPSTGLYAEHLFDDGVTGGDINDFWAHTQISAVLGGQRIESRGLALVRRHCWQNGIRGLAPSTLDAPYVAASTDDDVELELDSTAMWMLATWPELTHRYALAQTLVGNPDAAVEAIAAQMPGRLHQSASQVAPWYYAEKYLFPGDRPWLFTWGGDPTLVEATLGGFLGVRPTLDGMRVTPSLPSHWRRPLETHFTFRGARRRLRVDPEDIDSFELERTTIE